MKERSFTRECEMVVALERHFRGKSLHKISLDEWETYKDERLSGKLSPRKRPCSEATVIKEFKCLRAILSYATALGFLRWNVLANVKLGLSENNRADIWLTKDEIGKFLEALPGHMRPFFEFRIWTGARPEEAALFGRENINWETDEIWILTLKKRKKAVGGIRRRYFKIKELGPRFEALLKEIVPHPTTGLLFGNQATGQPYVARYVQNVFHRAVKAAGIIKRVPLIPYDLRGTFAAHRAMVVQSFRQLQSEMGHLDPKSIQHYLDEAAHHDPKGESIFFGIIDAAD
jgi:integrase